MINTPELPTNPRVEDHLERLRKIQMDLSTHLRHAQHTQKNYADRHRLPSSFTIGDQVWLLRRHIKTTRSCDKLDYRFVRNKLYYLVDWLGYSSSERTWEPVEHVVNAQDLLAYFHQQYPDKPGPQSAPTHSTRRLKGGIVS